MYVGPSEKAHLEVFLAIADVEVGEGGEVEDDARRDGAAVEDRQRQAHVRANRHAAVLEAAMGDKGGGGEAGRTLSSITIIGLDMGRPHVLRGGNDASGALVLSRDPAAVSGSLTAHKTRGQAQQNDHRGHIISQGV
jgi:hypothetical protein